LEAIYEKKSANFEPSAVFNAALSHALSLVWVRQLSFDCNKQLLVRLIKKQKCISAQETSLLKFLIKMVGVSRS
jgi:hypothetical protein